MLITICDNLLSYGSELIFYYYIRNKYNLLKNLRYEQYELSKLMFVCSYTNLSNGKIFVLLLKIEIGDWKLKKINRKDVAAQLLITNTFLIIKQRIKFYFYWIFILNIWNIL